MPNRIANVALIVHRDGKRIAIKPGQKFDFSKKEIEDFEKLMPMSLRLPINEDQQVDNQAPVNPNLTNSGAPGDGDMTGLNGGKKAEGDEKTLDEMTADELKAFAKANELEVNLNQNKADLLTAVKAAVAEQGDL